MKKPPIKFGDLRAGDMIRAGDENSVIVDIRRDSIDALGNRCVAVTWIETSPGESRIKKASYPAAATFSWYGSFIARGPSCAARNTLDNASVM